MQSLPNASCKVPPEAPATESWVVFVQIIMGRTWKWRPSFINVLNYFLSKMRRGGEMEMHVVILNEWSLCPNPFI